MLFKGLDVVFEFGRFIGVNGDGDSGGVIEIMLVFGVFLVCF